MNHFDDAHTSTEFDIDLEDSFGANVASNSSAMINSVYTAEATLIYNLGFTQQNSSIFVPVHVNPKINEIRKLILPNEWEPSVRTIYNVLLQTKSGSPITSPKKLSFAITKKKN